MSSQTKRRDTDVMKLYVYAQHSTSINACRANPMDIVDIYVTIILQVDSYTSLYDTLLLLIYHTIIMHIYHDVCHSLCHVCSLSLPLHGGFFANQIVTRWSSTSYLSSYLLYHTTSYNHTTHVILHTNIIRCTD